MPRKARIDAPGALHHIITRGIEGRPIFQNAADREDFIVRFSRLIIDTDLCQEDPYLLELGALHPSQSDKSQSCFRSKMPRKVFILKKENQWCNLVDLRNSL